MTKSNNEKDILALETISELKNYNNYTFNLIKQKIQTGKVLDFGCGFGVFSEYLQKSGYSVDGFDVNNEAVLESKSRGVNTFSDISQINQRYETVTSSNVLEHVEDDIALLYDIKSLLKENGTLVLYLPASKIAWTQMDEDVNHFRRYSKKELIEKLTRSGFKVRSAKYIDFIGWLVLIIFKLFRIKPKFNKKLLIFYDKFFFKNLKFLDYFFQKIVGKNLLVVADLKE
tara:strand:+ start:624 stop:1310 length:687 start_codon:yes stop_codon:yes gene_type:complete